MKTEYLLGKIVERLTDELERERCKVVSLEYEIKNLKEQLSYLRNAEHDKEGGKH